MSYENTACPCGDKKPTDTMLCDACETAFAGRNEMATFKDGSLPVEARRHAAIILVTLSRGRKRQKRVPDGCGCNDRTLCPHGNSELA